MVRDKFRGSFAPAYGSTCMLYYVVM